MMLVLTDMLHIMLVLIDTLLIIFVSIDMLLITLVNIDMQLIMLLDTYMLLIMLAKITIADAHSSPQNRLDSACSNTTEMVWVAGVGKGRTVQPFLCTSSNARSVLPSGLHCTLDQHSEATSSLVKPRFMQLCCKGMIVLQAICYT